MPDDKPTRATRPAPAIAKRPAKPAWWKIKSVQIALAVALAVGVIGVGSVGFITLVIALSSQPSVMKPKVYWREELETMLIGKTEEEVIKLIGKPESTSKNGGFTFWDYPNISVDKITGKTGWAHITLQRSVVTHVDF